MKKTMRLLRAAVVLCLLSLFLSTAVQAGDIRDGRAIVKPAEEDRYSIDGYTFGKAELFGYISELKETRNITGLVLKNGRGESGKATDEQRHSIVSIGKTLQLETFAMEGGDLTPLAAD